MTDSAKDFTGASYFAFLKDENKLMGVRCRACGRLSALPRPVCTACHSRDVEWHEFSGSGSLAAFTCISAAPASMVQKGYGMKNPYCVAVVDLEEGPRVSALIVGVDGSNPQDIKTGMPLVLDTSDLDPENPGLIFRPA